MSMNNNDSNPYFSFAGMPPEEMMLLQQATAGFNENQLRAFQDIYATKRKNPQDILILSLLALLGVAGIHRMVMGQVVLGLLYFFTWGFFGVMVVMDLIKNKTITTDYNQKMMTETYHMVKMGGY